MRSLLLLMLVAALSRPAASAQAPSTTPPIILNISVTDANNHPIRNLKPQDFHLTDDNAPQTIRSFAERSSLIQPPEPAPLPAMPPGTFTDFTPLPPNAPINILLLDALNTPTKDQAFIRYQLRQYVQQADPNTRIAIFGLANRLILLQSPTSDPSILRTAVEHKLIPRAPTLLDHHTSALTLPSPTDIAANLRLFQSQMGSLETDFRQQLTLDALNTLAHYLASLPGRKNLIWLSASFPYTTLPPPTPQTKASGPTDDQELRETADLLAKAQVSIDPIDARPLMAQPALDEAHPDHLISFSDDLKHLPQLAADEHTRIDQLSTTTGGQPIDNATNLAAAVAQAIAAGSNYYTLAYTPTNTAPTYHQIRITLSTLSQPHLAYLRGYYVEPAKPSPDPNSPEPNSTDAGRTHAYQNAALSRGAPTPQDLLFKVRVLPASTSSETSVAPDNQLSPDVSPKGPFRRYDLDFVALPAQLTLATLPNGQHSATVEFLAYIFDTDGRLLNATGKTISFSVPAANIARLQHSAMQCHLEISVPDRVETFFRIAERDVLSNKFGVVEIPTADVSHLPPAADSKPPAPPAPAGQSTPPQR